MTYQQLPQGYLRDVTDDDLEGWCAGAWPDGPPAHGLLVVVDELKNTDPDDARWWRAWPVAGTLPGCRFTVGPGGRQCKRPAVVTLLRGVTRAPWSYCDDPAHLYGRRWVPDPRALNSGRLEALRVVRTHTA